jgi:hypothetical protein
VSSRHLENYGRRNEEGFSSPRRLHLYQFKDQKDLKYGDEGFQELLKSNVDAIYVIVYRVPTGYRLPF